MVTDKDGISRGDWLVCVDQKQIKTEIPRNKRIYFQVETIDFALPSIEFLNNFHYIITPLIYLILVEYKLKLLQLDFFGGME